MPRPRRWAPSRQIRRPRTACRRLRRRRPPAAAPPWWHAAPSARARPPARSPRTRSMPQETPASATRALGAATLADQVRGAAWTRPRRVHGALRQHQAITGAQAELLALGAEGDLALDHPEALVVIVAVRGIGGRRTIVPGEGTEALGLEPVAKRRLVGCPRSGPRNALQAHQGLASAARTAAVTSPSRPARK